MGKDILSHNEIESLLGSLDLTDFDDQVPETPTEGPSLAQTSVAQPAAFWVKDTVVPYDFKRPERVGKEQMRALQSMHEGFGRNFGASLSAMLRSIVEVKLTSVDQLTYSEFVFSLENPSCYNVLNAQPLEGNLILDINPSILYPIIDRLLGGGKEVSPLARRPLTEIELRLVRRITDLFLGELTKAWANVIEFELTVARVESNPQLVQVVPPNEVVVLISFEVTLGEVRGMIHFCVPFNSIERISNKLTANSWFNFHSKSPSSATQEKISQQLSEATVQVVVELARSTIRTADLIGLRVGDIITTDQDCHGVLPVVVEGVRKFFAQPGVVKGRKAFQVDSVVAVPERPAVSDEEVANAPSPRPAAARNQKSEPVAS